jgi:SAM-dependent methyltransferase
MERISYDASNFSDLAILHFSRYCFASRFVKTKRVLDVGCGEGFGSCLLSEHAKSVIGCDVSSNAVSLCKSKFGGRANFLLCDGTKLPFSGPIFDVAIAFEVIEHLKNPCALLNQVCSILENNGIFLVSTPRRVISGLPLNPYHLREFSYEEFTGILSSSFESVEIVGQKVLKMRWRIMHRITPFIPVRIRRIMRQVYSLSKGNPTAKPFTYPNGCKTSEVDFVRGISSRNAEYFVAICRYPKKV